MKLLHEFFNGTRKAEVHYIPNTREYLVLCKNDNKKEAHELYFTEEHKAEEYAEDYVL